MGRCLHGLPLALLLAPALAGASTYYVAPGGLDTNPGTEALPFGTIKAAHDVARAGDTIYLRGGTYNIAVAAVLTRSGENGHPIKLWAYPGELPVLDASSITTEPTWVIVLSGASWWHVKGLEIKNNAHGGAIRLSNNANHNIIEGNNTHHNGALSAWAATGIVLYGNPSDNLILNNDSHHNRDANCGDADGIDLGVTSSGNVLRGNRVWANSDDGIDLFNTNDNTEGGIVLIDGNWSWGNGYDADGNPCGNGMGFKLGGTRPNTTGTSGGHTVRNNVAWANLSIGFDENSSERPSILYNNTARNNGIYNYGFWSQPNIFRNNLAAGTGGLSASGDAAVNSWTLPVTVDDADFVSIDPACAAAPRKPDGSLPDCGFLHLAAGSDLIDKGVDVGLPYGGPAPDLGAFEALPNDVIFKDGFQQTSL